MNKPISSVSRVLVVDCDDYPVKRGGLVVVLNSGWTIEEMSLLQSEYSGKSWGYADEGDSLPRSYKIYSVKNKSI